MTIYPIFIISAPRLSTNKELRSYRDLITDQLPDYHVLIHLSVTGEDFTFQVFNPNDAEEINIEELKQLLLLKDES